MADSIPLPKAEVQKNRKTPLQTKETNNNADHYAIAAAGLHGNHQYADLALLLKKTNIINK